MDSSEADPRDIGEIAAGRRLPHLDGLRGIAALLVLFYHQTWILFPGGGKMGVGLFFVLSGFLITSILARERTRTGGVRFGSFYLRRARRLLPALAGFCLFWWLWAALGAPTAAQEKGLEFLDSSILQVATFTSNLGYVLGWDSFGYFRHMWSLAVEEQFYLVWPLLLCFVVIRRRHPARWALGLAVAVAAARLIFWWNGADYRLLYDTMQWDGLLLGCALALAPRLRLPVWTLRPALIAFGLLLLIPKQLLGYLATVDFIVQALSCAVILHHARRLPWLEHPVLVHLGLVSYGLYIWHYPFTKMWGAWLAIPLSLIAAELSYRLIERPFLWPRGRAPARALPERSEEPLADLQHATATGRP